jgi:hypothetical protein
MIERLISWIFNGTEATICSARSDSNLHSILYRKHPALNHDITRMPGVQDLDRFRRDHCWRDQAPEWQRLGNASCLLVTHQAMHNQLSNLLHIFCPCRNSRQCDLAISPSLENLCSRCSKP